MEEELYSAIVEAATEVHRVLGGPGMLESIYESALCHELMLRGYKTQRQVPIPVVYKKETVRDPLFLDIIVDNRLIIEVKATSKDYPVYPIQLLTYLRLTDIEWGLLINFGKRDIAEGIHRVCNSFAIR